MSAEIAAGIMERFGENLLAPVARVASADVPVPFTPVLEDAYRPDRARIAAAVRELSQSIRANGSAGKARSMSSNLKICASPVASSRSGSFRMNATSSRPAAMARRRVATACSPRVRDVGGRHSGARIGGDAGQLRTEARQVVKFVPARLKIGEPLHDGDGRL